MAGQLKEVRNRIKSIQSTQQITKAMKMISATKLRKAQEAIQQMRPYSKKLQDRYLVILSATLMAIRVLPYPLRDRLKKLY